MKNKLKLGQAAGVVAFAIIIGAVSMSSSSTVDARTTKAEANKNRSVNAGVALNLTDVADATELLTAGVTSALTYYGADVSVAQNDSNVVTASAQGAQAGDTAQETEQANEAAQTPTAAQTCGYTNLGMSVISSGNLNIRQEASTDSEVVGILTNHNACELLEDAGEWYKVTSGKVTGYVNKQYLVTGDEAESIAEQEIKTVATVNTETLNVRAEKSTDAAVLSQVGNSEAFTVNSVADGWVEISVDDSVGYISQDYVTLAQALPTAKTIEQVKYGDGVVMYKGTRYRGYVYVNPSTMKVIRSSYSEGGISVDNVYYDNVIHICVYEGRRMLYGKDITKKAFAGIFPEDILSQMILADMNFMGVDNKGYQYQATLRVPESSVYSLADITIGFDNRMDIKKAE